MTLGFAASLLASVLIGLLSIGCAWRRPTAPPGSTLLVGCLAVGIGLGLSSVVFFVWLSLGAPGVMFPLGELGLLLLLAGVVLRTRTRRHSRKPPVKDGPTVAPATIHQVLALALGVGIACGMVAFLIESAANRQGGWDAWMTWNMHARAIFRGGEHWRQVLTGLPGWSHADYPLLLPGSVARMWTYIGHETQLAPASVAMLFTFATVGLLYSSVAVLRSPTQGALAALLLLGTKFFILHGATQYADVPFGFFLLATLVLLALPEIWPDDRPCLLALAGATAGLSAWTKNEGLLLLPVVVAGYGLMVVRARGWRTGLHDARAFAIGLAPILAVVVCFKILLAPANDLMSDQGLRQTAERLLEGSRYLQVFAGAGKALLQVSANGVVVLLLLAYVFCAGPATAGPWRLGAKTAAMVLTLMLLGYTVVLLTAPAPLLATNIRSIYRLLLQLWPSMLLAYSLSLRTAEEAGLVRQPPSRADAARRASDRSVLPLSEAS
jgi:hypothetical protein